VQPAGTQDVLDLVDVDYVRVLDIVSQADFTDLNAGPATGCSGVQP
jgi:hypothetical protein